ncbi:MAG: methionine gamma-lyase family protein, partial [Clostridia bacterium]|nr:methionine gamma-lyase family protein [Clostridia bacterium]
MNEKIIQKCEKKLSKQFEILEDIALYNQEKVLKAFQEVGINTVDFAEVNGYGY